MALALALALAGNVGAATDYGFCTVCHGAEANGNPAIHAPKLSGMEPWYLQRQLEDFRAQRRGTSEADEAGLEMQPVARQLTDADIKAVVAYIGTLEARLSPRTVQGDAGRGRGLYAPCAACHGARAEGNATLQAPALASQPDWYLVTQLEHFRRGMRGYSKEDPQGNAMRAATAVLPDDGHAIADVVAYISTLAPRARAP